MNNERNAPGSHCSAVDCLWHHHQNDAGAAAAAASAAAADHKNMIKNREERRKTRQEKKKQCEERDATKRGKDKKTKGAREDGALYIVSDLCPLSLCHHRYYS